MGTFAWYTGSMNIPEDKKEIFAKQMNKILYYGGMMNFEKISIYGHKIGLLEPVRPLPGETTTFHFNYFEDDSWETAGFDSSATHFWSGKVGGQEFCDIILAAYTLCELYDDSMGLVMLNDKITDFGPYIAWLNNLLGTDFTMEKRRNLWNTVESYVLNGDNDVEDFSFSDLLDLIPHKMLKYAGGIEFADLFFITRGTGTLTKDCILPGSYPADILDCKNAISDYLAKGNVDEKKVKLYDLLRMDRKKRERISDPGLKRIAEWSLILPARVITYLSSEYCEDNFWEQWKDVYNNVYHDEISKVYASEELEKERTTSWFESVPKLSTSEFLRQDKWFTFYSTPEELEMKPKYYISDDDRLYWWDGSDEVIISEEMEKWLKELSERHSHLMQAADKDSKNSYDSDAFIKDFLNTLIEIDNTYKRISPFQNMFYDFLQNGQRKEYRAAIMLLRELADENKDEGNAIRYLKHSWGLTSRKVTFNPGRLRIKRYMSIMANLSLRMKYFGF